MNKAIILTALSLLLTVSSMAQVMAFKEPFANVGVKLGGNFEQISSAPLKSGPGLLVGVYASKSVGKFGVRIEATGSTAQYKTKYPAAYYVTHTPGMDTNTVGNFQVVYINVPLLFEYIATPKLHLLVGPQFGYMASITDKNKVYADIYGNSNILTTTDFSLVGGVEYVITKRMQVGARFVKGVTDVNNSTYYLIHKPWSSTGGQVSISYRIL